VSSCIELVTESPTEFHTNFCRKACRVSMDGAFSWASWPAGGDHTRAKMT